MSAAEEKLRRRLLAGLSGRVLEIGCGPGTNFPFYPAEVTEVVAIEPEPRLRHLALKAAGELPTNIAVLEGIAESLPVENRSCDAAVASFVLCSVSNPGAALSELMRVIRPGGELRFYEHVVALNPVAAGMQRTLDASIWPLVAGGCHCARDTLASITDAGFVVEVQKRLAFRPLGMPLPVSPLIVGTARRP